MLCNSYDKEKLIQENHYNPPIDLDNIHNHEIVNNYLFKIKDYKVKTSKLAIPQHRIEEQMFTNKILKSFYGNN